jgi:hypothetical protein
METLKTALITILALGQLALVIWMAVYYYVETGGLK